MRNVSSTCRIKNIETTGVSVCGDDPMPFLAMYLIQIPSLLVLELLAGKPWLKVDFCIGKIVKEGGD